MAPNGSLEELFARYVEDGDEQAMGELVRRTRPRLLGIARRIGSPADADDAAQTAYLSLVRKGADMDAPVLPWLVTAVVRIAYAAKAARAKRTRLAERLSRLPATPVPDVPGAAIRAEEIARLRRGIDQLPAPYRDVVALHLQGLAASEVAQLLDVTAEVVRKRLERARRLIRSRWNTRLAGGLLALPWLLEDAAAAMLGGLAVKKAVLAVSVLLVLGVGVGTTIVHRSAPRARQDSPHATATTLADGRPADAAPAPAAPATAPRTGYFGIVVDPAGQPVANARVELRSHLGRSSGGSLYRPDRDTDPAPRVAVATGGDGTFTIEPRLRWENIVGLELHVVADGHARTIARAFPDTETRIVLRPGGTLRVAVHTADGPVADAPVHLCEGVEGREPEWRGIALVSAHTDAGGVASFPIEPGSYRVAVRPRGLVPFLGDPVEVAAGQVTPVEVATSVGTVVAVTVRDETGAPVADADVELRGPLESGDRVRTDADGRCRVAGIAPPPTGWDYWRRAMWWHVEKPGFAAARGSRQITPEPGEEALAVTLRRGAPVEVRVVDGAGAPVGYASVGGSYRTNAANPIRRFYGGTTAADGRVSLGRLAPGTWPVTVRPPGGAAGITDEIEVGADPVAYTVRLETRTATIRGVVQLPDGTPAHGGTIGFKADDGTVTGLGMICVHEIGADGTFRLDKLRAGPGRIDARVDGFAAQSRPSELKPGESRVGFVFLLEEAGEVRGRVVTREGEALAGIPVRLMQDLVYPGGARSIHEVGRTTTGAGGSFRLRGLSDDEYRLHVQTKEWRTVDVFTTVRAGMDDLVVRMKPAAEGSGIPLRVRFSTDDGSQPDGPIQAEYTADGDLRIVFPSEGTDDGPAELRFWHGPGTYDLTFHCPGYLPCVVRGVRVEEEPDLPPLDVRFRRGAVVRVLVRGADGAPLRGMSVRVGNQLLRTDSNGECDVGGLEPGARDLRVDLAGQRYVFGEVEGVRAPGRAEITIRRWGYAYVRLDGWTYGDLRERLHWRLLDARGEVVDESPFDLAKVGHGYAPDRGVSAWLKSAAPGDYRAVVEVDGKRGEVAVHIDLGSRSDATLTAR